MTKQVDKEAYSFKKYCQPERWAAYWYQLDEIFDFGPASVLEIGVGDGAVGDYLKRNGKIKYASVDIDEELKPDFAGSIDNLPLNDNSFDVVCAFEVMEHLPFEKFAPSLKEIRRVCRRGAVISLPHWGRHFSMEIRLPYFKKLGFQLKLNPFPIKHEFNGQHYWEMGKRGYPLKKIKKEIIAAGFKIRRDYTAFYSPYHHFFILEK